MTLERIWQPLSALPAQQQQQQRGPTMGCRWPGKETLQTMLAPYNTMDDTMTC